MAKVNAPLLSFGASGAIANAQVYSRWRGVPYARRYVVPGNPNTLAQQATRSVFRWLQAYWVQAGVEARLPWNTAAVGRPVLGVNLFTGANVSALRTKDDLDDMIGSASAHGGFPATDLAVTPGDEQLSCAISVAEPPTGWSLERVVAVAIQEQDPSAQWVGRVYEGSQVDPMDPVVLEDLENDTEYRVFAWPVWTKPDGRLSVGASISDTATPTA